MTIAIAATARRVALAGALAAAVLGLSVPAATAADTQLKTAFQAATKLGDGLPR